MQVQSMMYLGNAFHSFGAAALSFERKLYPVAPLIVIGSLMYCGALKAMDSFEDN